MSRLCRLQPIFPAVAADTKAGKIGTLLLNALKTSFSYFDKLGSFCLSRLCRLQPIFPALAAHTKAGKIGTLLLNALKTSFSYFDKLGSFCLSRLCRLQPIFPAVAAHTKAGKIGTLLLNALKTSFSYFDKLGSFCLSRLCRLRRVISEARSLFRGDAGDVILNCLGIWLKPPTSYRGNIPSGKLTQKTMDRSTMLLMGKSTISMVIFNSKLLVYQRVHDLTGHKRSLPKLAFVLGELKKKQVAIFIGKVRLSPSQGTDFRKVKFSRAGPLMLCDVRPLSLGT